MRRPCVVQSDWRWVFPKHSFRSRFEPVSDKWKAQLAGENSADRIHKMASQIKAIHLLSVIMRIEQGSGSIQILQQILLQGKTRIITLPS
jgi:hypothetical protein